MLNNYFRLLFVRCLNWNSIHFVFRGATTLPGYDGDVRETIFANEWERDHESPENSLRFNCYWVRMIMQFTALPLNPLAASHRVHEKLQIPRNGTRTIRTIHHRAFITLLKLAAGRHRKAKSRDILSVRSERMKENKLLNLKSWELSFITAPRGQPTNFTDKLCRISDLCFLGGTRNLPKKSEPENVVNRGRTMIRESSTLWLKPFHSCFFSSYRVDCLWRLKRERRRNATISAPFSAIRFPLELTEKCFLRSADLQDERETRKCS